MRVREGETESEGKQSTDFLQTVYISLGNPVWNAG